MTNTFTHSQPQKDTLSHLALKKIKVIFKEEIERERGREREREIERGIEREREGVGERTTFDH